MIKDLLMEVLMSFKYMKNFYCQNNYNKYTIINVYFHVQNAIIQRMVKLVYHAKVIEYLLTEVVYVPMVNMMIFKVNIV